MTTPKTTIENSPPRRLKPARKQIAALAAAFAIGAFGTAAIMSSMRPTASSQTAQNGALQTQPSESVRQSDESPRITLSAAAMRTAGIRSEAVRRTLSVSTLTVPGTVMTSPNQAARITPPVSGKVIHILVNVGDRVHAGQSLAVLDSVDVAQAHAAVRQAETNITQAVAAVNTAQAQVQEAQGKQAAADATVTRQQQLAQVGAFSQAPLAAAQSELSQAQAELAQAQSENQTRTSAEARAKRLYQAQIVSSADLEQAQANLRQSQARTDQGTTRVALAAQALARERKVYGGGLLDKQAIQTAQAEARNTQAQTRTAVREAQATVVALSAARSAAISARANLTALEGDRHTEGGAGLILMRTPISGIVTDRQATVGEAVERGTSLFLIENLSAVLVSANVPEAQIGKVHLGQQAQVTVSAYPDNRYQGAVQSIASHVDEKTRALAVRILVGNENGRLRPEMFAQASLDVGPTSQRIVVPAAAVDEDGEGRFVYVEQKEGYEKRKVEVGRMTDTSAVIENGLTPGERVATSGVFVLKSESKKDELKGDD